jgi:site-specific recombinase XerD
MEKIPDVTEQEWKSVNEWNKNITGEFLEQGHLSPQTLKQYESALRIFFRWVCENANNKPLYELKPKDALRYQNYLINKGLSSSAIKLKRSAVSSLCGYIELYYLDEFPTFRNIYNKKIPNPSQSFKNEKKPLNDEEYDLLIKTLEKEERWQMLAYVKFTYASGCRRAEARQLLKEVVNYEKVKDKNFYLTHNIRCKGRGREGNIRKLQFDEEAKIAIDKWLEVRGEDDCEFVFVVYNNGKYQQVSETTFNTWCKDVFSKIVGRRVHPHQFREQRATDLVIKHGKDIKTAQALLGHKDASTTEIYVIRDSSNDVDDAF